MQRKHIKGAPALHRTVQNERCLDDDGGWDAAGDGDRDGDGNGEGNGVGNTECCNGRFNAAVDLKSEVH